jgi:hypothetical protein
MNYKSANESDKTPSVEELRTESNSYLGAGVGLGVFGVASGALLGAVCPLCIVATPALLGAGVYKRICANRAAKQSPAAVPTARAAAQEE